MFCVGCPLVNAMQCVGLVSSRRTNEVRKVVPASQYRFEKLTATWDTAGKTFWVVVALTTSTQQALVASMHFHLNEGDQDDQDEGDSLDEIWNLNDPLLSRLVAPRVTPPPQQEVVPARARPAFVFLPETAAARPASSASASSGRGGGARGGGGGSQLTRRIDGRQVMQLQTAIFTFMGKPSTVAYTGGLMSMSTAHALAKGILEEGDPNPLKEASVRGGWAAKTDWKDQIFVVLSRGNSKPPFLAPIWARGDHFEFQEISLNSPYSQYKV